MDRLRNLLIASLLFFSLPLAAADKININSADAESLMTIQGVGEKRAEAIIEHREKNGPFASVEELMKVDGVGPATLDNNRDRLSVE